MTETPPFDQKNLALQLLNQFQNYSVFLVKGFIILQFAMCYNLNIETENI